MALPLIAGVAIAGLAVSAGTSIFSTISQNHMNEEAMQMQEKEQQMEMAQMQPFMQSMTQQQAQNGQNLQQFMGTSGGLNSGVNQFTQQTMV